MAEAVYKLEDEKLSCARINPMSSNLFIQMGTTTDPSKVKASLGSQNGEIDNRTKSGTEIFDSAFRVRDYVYENKSDTGEKQEFRSDSKIKTPQTDGPAGSIRGLQEAASSIARSNQYGSRLLWHYRHGVSKVLERLDWCLVVQTTVRHRQGLA